MDLVNLNPYRILGVYANAPSNTWPTLKRDIDTVASKPLPFTSYLPDTPRSPDLVLNVLEQLQDPYERMRYAQFWFYVTTPEDEEALKHIRSRDMPSALKLWSWKDTVSSLQNRMVCSLILGKYKEAVRYAEHIYSHYTDELITPVVGTEHGIDQNDLILNFWQALEAEVLATNPDLMPLLPQSWEKVIHPPKQNTTQPATEPKEETPTATNDTSKPNQTETKETEEKGSNTAAIITILLAVWLFIAGIGIIHEFLLMGSIAFGFGAVMFFIGLFLFSLNQNETSEEEAPQPTSEPKETPQPETSNINLTHIETTQEHKTQVESESNETLASESIGCIGSFLSPIVAFFAILAFEAILAGFLYLIIELF